MLGERPRVSDEQQAAFVASYSQHDGDVRLVPEALFSATGNDRRIDRLYHKGPQFRVGRLAMFDKSVESGLPKTILNYLGNHDAVSIALPSKSDDTVRFHAQTGKFSLSLRYFPHEGEELAPLYDIGLEDNTIPRHERGHQYAGMLGYWTNIRDRSDLSEIMRKGGLIYDHESGVFEVRLGDMVVRALDHLPAHGILESYFPPELRENPLEAGIEHDVWARANWMQDFGITWVREQRIEVPVFDAQALSTPTAS
jgi:hypothetical protein